MSNDIFDNIGTSGPFPNVDPDTISQFGIRLTRAISANDIKEAVNAALNFGIDVGISLCRDAMDANSEWSEPRSPKEWRAHYRRLNKRNYHFKTIKNHVTYRPITTKWVQILKKDLDKTW